MKHACCLCLLLLLLAFPLSLGAQTLAQCQVDLATILYEDGKRAYDEKNYTVALVKFNQAYRLCPFPVFLQTSAICHAKLGNLEDATLSGSLAIRVNERRGNRIGGLAPKEVTQLEANVVAWRRIQVAQDQTQRVTMRSPVVTVTTNPPPDPKRDLLIETSPPMSTGQKLGWGFVGVGVASLVASGVVWVLLEQKVDELEGASPGSSQTFEQNKQDAQQLQSIGQWTLIGAGAALLTGSAILLFSSPQNDSSAKNSLSPHTPGTFQLGWSTRF